MASIKVRKSSVSPDVVAVLHDDTLGAERVVIQGFGPCEGGVELQSVREPLTGRHPERVVARVARTIDFRNVAERSPRQYRARTGQRRVMARSTRRLVDVSPEY